MVGQTQGNVANFEVTRSKVKVTADEYMLEEAYYRIPQPHETVCLGRADDLSQKTLTLALLCRKIDRKLSVSSGDFARS